MSCTIRKTGNLLDKTIPEQCLVEAGIEKECTSNDVHNVTQTVISTSTKPRKPRNVKPLLDSVENSIEKKTGLWSWFTALLKEEQAIESVKSKNDYLLVESLLVKNKSVPSSTTRVKKRKRSLSNLKPLLKKHKSKSRKKRKLV